MLDLFNGSILEGIWKSTAITPIHKTGSIHNVENYRGISILNYLSKKFESLVYDALYPKDHHIISEYEHGSMKNHLMLYLH